MARWRLCRGPACSSTWRKPTTATPRLVGWFARDAKPRSSARSAWTTQRRRGLPESRGRGANTPQRMRQMRARAWAMRDGFADVLKGIGIAEEGREFPVGEGGEVEAPPPTRPILYQKATEEE